MRQVVLDTETTGLEPEEGHRILEIGCVELVDRKFTRHTYHQYINPEREIDDGALEVHGITREFLDDKPLFADVADEFMAFIEGAELIIHNAAFDVAFINQELSRIEARARRVEDICTIVDTLEIARRKHPGQRNSLDALCKRYNVDNSQRVLHGALLDAEILADVYLLLTGGQARLELEDAGSRDTGIAPGAAWSATPLKERSEPLRIIRPTEEELRLHEEKLDEIDGAAVGGSLWRSRASDEAGA